MKISILQQSIPKNFSVSKFSRLQNLRTVTQNVADYIANNQQINKLKAGRIISFQSNSSISKQSYCFNQRHFSTSSDKSSSDNSKSNSTQTESIKSDLNENCNDRPVNSELSSNTKNQSEFIVDQSSLTQSSNKLRLPTDLTEAQDLEANESKDSAIPGTATENGLSETNLDEKYLTPSNSTNNNFLTNIELSSKSLGNLHQLQTLLQSQYIDLMSNVVNWVSDDRKKEAMNKANDFAKLLHLYVSERRNEQLGNDENINSEIKRFVSKSIRKLKSNKRLMNSSKRNNLNNDLYRIPIDKVAISPDLQLRNINDINDEKTSNEDQKVEFESDEQKLNSGNNNSNNEETPENLETEPIDTEETDEINEIPISQRMTPEEVHHQLNRYIIGQEDAKKAVAMAMRDRFRRQQLPKELQAEIKPSHLLLQGPTGSGKSEIARRLAKLTESPFVKKEMTSYTEVGIHGADLQTIIQDLMDVSVKMCEENERNRLSKLFEKSVNAEVANIIKEQIEMYRDTPIEDLISSIQKGEYDKIVVTYNLPTVASNSVSTSMNDPLRGILPFLISLTDVSKRKGPIGAFLLNEPSPRQSSKRKMVPYDENDSGFEIRMGSNGNSLKYGRPKDRVSIKRVRQILMESRVQANISPQKIIEKAIKAAENGTIYLDEIDKLARTTEFRNHGSKGEGVQRELLALLEGTTVKTSYGMIKTDHILFIAAGAFHSSKPSDLMAELQGRLPVRVILTPLSESDFLQILTTTEFNLCKQQTEMLSTEGVKLNFTPDGIAEIAKIAKHLNDTSQNTGARRLVSVISQVVSDISYSAPTKQKIAIEQGKEFHEEIVDQKYVRQKLAKAIESADLTKYLL